MLFGIILSFAICNGYIIGFPKSTAEIKLATCFFHNIVVVGLKVIYKHSNIIRSWTKLLFSLGSEFYLPSTLNTALFASMKECAKNKFLLKKEQQHEDK